MDGIVTSPVSDGDMREVDGYGPRSVKIHYDHASSLSALINFFKAYAREKLVSNHDLTQIIVSQEKIQRKISITKLIYTTIMRFIWQTQAQFMTSNIKEDALDKRYGPHTNMVIYASKGSSELTLDIGNDAFICNKEKSLWIFVNLFDVSCTSAILLVFLIAMFPSPGDVKIFGHF
ncbi:hypothetical protein ACJX0J_027148 [Zea mays]